MPHRWPADTDFRLWELDVLDRDCASCGGMMHICDHRYRHLDTLEGPVQTGSASSITAPILIAQGTPRPRAPRWRRRSLCPPGPSVGTSSAGSGIVGSRDTGRFPRFVTN